MKTICLLLFGLTLAVASMAGPSFAEDAPLPRKPLSVKLWPGRVPGKTAEERQTTLSGQGDGVQRITNVNKPTLTLFEAERPSGGLSPAMLVCPGGGYRLLSFDKEGTEIAEWLRSIGMTAAVLKYRVPSNRAGAFQDAQRAMGLLRQKARQWNIDPARIGVIGFSAGAHLAARLSTDHEKRAYAAVDEADRVVCRPEFAVLVYPAYLARDGYALPSNVVVTSRTPPTFLVQAQDDKKYIDSSIAYYLALKKSGVAGELHVFPSGGHGFGLRQPDEKPIARWPELCEAWLRDRGIMEQASKNAID
ncbi:MAG: alpha/beta hydrolase [Pirellulales bacterium]|nr:alpha/beta hydrolase [Pirellulales bacterium]